MSKLCFYVIFIKVKGKPTSVDKDKSEIQRTIDVILQYKLINDGYTQLIMQQKVKILLYLIKKRPP